MSHRGVLPDNIKGTHSKKSLGQETLTIHTSLCFQSCPPDASAAPRPTLPLTARYWHCSFPATSSVLVWFPVVTAAAFIFPLSGLCPWLWWSVLLCFFCVMLAHCWEPTRKLKLCQVLERLFKLVVKTGVCVSACASHWHGVRVCFRWWVCYFFSVWTRGPLKKTDIHCHTRTARQQVGGDLSLFVRLCYHLLFPVKTGKSRGENGG